MGPVEMIHEKNKINKDKTRATVSNNFTSNRRSERIVLRLIISKISSKLE